MNARERFHATCKFEAVDRPVRYEAWGFWRETLKLWNEQGAPLEIVDNETVAFDYFGCDSLCWLPTTFGIDEPGFWPLFDEKTIEQTDTFIIKQDIAGNIVKSFIDGHSTIPQVLSNPIKTLKDFEALKWRLDPEAQDRFSLLIDPMIAYTNSVPDNFTALYVCGLFGTYRHLMGLKGLSIALRKDPNLVKAIAEHWVHMNSVLIKKIRERSVVDFVFFWEDMAYKNGPMISPAAFKEFMSPYYSKIINNIKSETDIRVFCVDSDGDVNLLIPLFIETGINMMLPFEVNAGMDIRTIRQRYGKNLIILGGIDKTELFKDEKSIEKEVLEKVPYMLKSGGYIPCLDHTVPPEVSLKNFKKYLEIVRGLS
jgi:uroporphyrinogen decarboxylase